MITLPQGPLCLSTALLASLVLRENEVWGLGIYVREIEELSGSYISVK